MSMIVPEVEPTPAGSVDRDRLTAAGLAAELAEGPWLEELIDRARRR